MSHLPPHPPGRRVWSFRTTKEKDFDGLTVIRLSRKQEGLPVNGCRASRIRVARGNPGNSQVVNVSDALWSRSASGNILFNCTGVGTCSCVVHTWGSVDLQDEAVSR